MKWLLGFCVLLGFQALGEGATRVLHLPIPGAVVGMLLLWGALGLKMVRLEWVEQPADHLLSILGLLFVPAGAGLVLYLHQSETLLVLLGCMLGVLLLASGVMVWTGGKKHD